MPPEASSNLPMRRSCASVNAPFLVTEQFALEQRFGQRRAVHRDKRLVSPATQVVHAPRDNFFPRAVLTQDQHRQLGVRDTSHRRTQRLNGGALADQLHAGRRIVGHLVAGLQQLLVLLRILQHHRRVCGQFRERRLILIGEIAGALVDQFERAEQLAPAPAQGNAQQRPCLKAQLLIDAAINLLLPGLAVDAARLACANHLSDNPRVLGNAQFPACHTQRRTADQRLRLTIPQKHAGSFRGEQADRRFRHLLEQLVHLQRLSPLGGDPQHELQALDAMALTRPFADCVPPGGQQRSRAA